MMEFAAGAGGSPVSSVVGPGVRVRAAAADPGCGPGGVTDERFAAGGFFDARDMVQVKYEMVRTTREDGLSVSRDRVWAVPAVVLTGCGGAGGGSAGGPSRGGPGRRAAAS